MIENERNKMKRNLFNKKALYMAGLSAAAAVGGYEYVVGGPNDGMHAIDASVNAAWGALIALFIYRLNEERTQHNDAPALDA